EMLRIRSGAAAPSSANPSNWKVVQVDTPVAAGPFDFDGMIKRALDQGIRQIKAAGSPLNPFLMLESGRAFFFVCTSGDPDPMQIALLTLKQHGDTERRCALVVDSRLTLANGDKQD